MGSGREGTHHRRGSKPHAGAPRFDLQPGGKGFAVLANPTRRAILEELAAGSASISELANTFDMSLTGTRKHVQLLEQADIVTTAKVGRVRSCTLAPDTLEGLRNWLQRLCAPARARDARVSSNWKQEESVA